MVASFTDRVAALLDLGGPVVAFLLLLSMTVLSVVLYKLWQFRALGVGRHAAIERAVALRDTGAASRAAQELEASPSHLAPVLRAAVEAPPGARSRLAVMAEARLAEVERGFRLLDAIAQVAPLLGLFGTVLGMIDAFRALQEAGQAVDPAALAGGIWVALLTTAAGLAVAMPTSLVLTWFESRAARERAMADAALEALLHPMEAAPGQASADTWTADEGLAHAG